MLEEKKNLKRAHNHKGMELFSSDGMRLSADGKETHFLQLLLVFLFCFFF